MTVGGSDAAPVRVGVAVIGAGVMGRVHVAELVRAKPLLRRRGVLLDVVVVVDVDEAAAREIAESVGAETTSDWRAAISRADVGLVDVCLPDVLHAEVAIESARNGKHVLCQKPLAATAQESRAMLAAVEGAGVTHAVDYMMRKLPAVSFAKELIETGRLGRVHFFRATFARDLALRPEAAKMWRFTDAGRVAGSLHAMGSHALDLARHLGGEVVAIAGATHHADDGDGRATQDVATLTLEFASGGHGSVQTTWSAAGHQHRTEVEVHGTEGSLHLSGARPNELYFARAHAPQESDGFTLLRAGRTNEYAADLDLQAGIAAGFHDCNLILLLDVIRAAALGEATSFPTFVDGLRADRMLDAAVVAAEERRWVSVEAH